MRVHTIASSHIGHSPTGALETRSGVPFDPAIYSRMKYGSQAAARTLGVQLGRTLLQSAPHLVLDPRPLVTLMCYRYVPSAAATITRAAMGLLSEARLRSGLDDVRYVRVITNKVVARDYSSLDEAGRTAYLAETDRTLRQEDVDRANVIVVDDVRNTGTAEDRVLRFTADKGIENLVLAYVAIIDTDDPHWEPSVERRLNVSTIKDLNGLLELIEFDGMTLTIRTIKMVLSMANKADEELKDFLRKLPPQLLFELYTGTLGSGREFVEHYADGLAIVRSIAVERNLLPA